MQLEIAHAPVIVRHDGELFYFCSDRCADKFVSEPGRAATAKVKARAGHQPVKH
jgi:YHS domain-containing protein